MKEKYPFYQMEKVESIVELIKRSKKLYGDSVAIRYKVKGQITEKSYNDVYFDSVKIAKFLINQNFSIGHIGVLGSSSYEWIISYLGTVFAGLVVVPIDKELPFDDIAELVSKAEVDCIIYAEEYSKIIDHYKDYDITTISFNKLMAISDSETVLPTVEPDKLSAIIFTSGTTGKGKGVMLTQRNIASNVIQGAAVNLVHGKDIIMSVLPLSHTYEFTCTILGMLYRGVTICISSGLKYVQKDFSQYHPTVMFVVPLFAETLYKNIEANIKKENKEKAFNSAVKIAEFFKKLHIDLTDKLFSEIKAAFGGRLRIIMCGGAPLSEELIAKYDAIGINLFQGYGLTECSPLLAVNFDYYHRPNSVGKVVEGNDVKIVDGEIWAKGISVTKGYYNDPEETEKSFENGWFKTGDLGYVDEDGFLFITGRKKNLIILDNGENVSAEELEALIYKIIDVDEVIVYGKENKIIAEIFTETDNKQYIRNEIDKLNTTLPSYKQIDDVIFRLEPFEKTTSKKIKRR